MSDPILGSSERTALVRAGARAKTAGAAIRAFSHALVIAGGGAPRVTLTREDAIEAVERMLGAIDAVALAAWEERGRPGQVAYAQPLEDAAKIAQHLRESTPARALLLRWAARCTAVAVELDPDVEPSRDALLLTARDLLWELGLVEGGRLLAAYASPPGPDRDRVGLCLDALRDKVQPLLQSQDRRVAEDARACLDALAAFWRVS